MKRVVALLIVAALVVGALATAVLVLRGSGSDSSDPVPTTTRTAAPSPRPAQPAPTPDPALARYDDQTIAWKDCPDDPGDRCARLLVPLDYTRPSGRTLTLALLKVPATDPSTKVGTLVVNPGGPGEPGTTYAAAARSYFGTAVRDDDDIVGFDPRGTGDSSPIDCLSDAALDTYLAGDPDPDTPAEEAAYVAGVRAFNAGCAQRSGALAAHVSTVEAARDMDVLRAALHEPRLDYFGASYGTKLGATYAQLYPTHVGRMVLDGAVDLRLTRTEAGVQNAVGFQTALTAYVQHCVDQGNCFLGDSVAAGLARISGFLRQVDGRPLSTSSGRLLTEGEAFYGIITPLYNRSYWTYLSVGLKRAFGGDGSVLLALADSINSRGADGYTNNLQEAIVDISCLDDPQQISAAQVLASVPEFERASTVFGRAFAWSQTACDGFTPRASEPPPDTTAPGAPPILVIGTTRDPATPYRWAVALSHELSSAVLVKRDGDGHTGYHAGNACVDTTVENFLIDGTVPGGPVSC